ncbi:MAG: prolipoprotein diacylglyceryl transferase family protein [Planctomycetota bacterium]
MRRTMFLIPHELGALPIVGVGWALLIVGIALLLRLSWAARQRSRFGEDAPSVGAVLASEAVFWGMAAGLVTFLLPRVELDNAFGEPVGMAIRGYGVFLLLGVVSAVGLSAYRASRDPELKADQIYALAPWVFVGGILGARMFYVIQYRDEFIGSSFSETLRNMVAFTEGGLVVYGSIIGGLVAFCVFCLRHRISALRLGDAIIPALFLGICLGRIGCLMNGCCYGGRCEEGWSSIRFPPINEVYQLQLESGELLGMDVDPDNKTIRSVTPGSPADQKGIVSGDVYESGSPDPRPLETADPGLPRGDVELGWIASISGRVVTFSPDDLPDRSLPVSAAQVISSMMGLCLCLLLCAVSRFLSRPGALMLIGFAAYAVVRFVLEIVRVDEAGQFNTTLSISQWVSVVSFIGSVAGLSWIMSRKTEPTSHRAEA